MTSLEKIEKEKMIPLRVRVPLPYLEKLRALALVEGYGVTVTEILRRLIMSVSDAHTVLLERGDGHGLEESMREVVQSSIGCTANQESK